MEHGVLGIELQSYKLLAPPARPDSIARRALLQQLTGVGAPSFSSVVLVSPESAFIAA